jgi:3-oxoadipate enol-lactonase
MPLVQVNGIDLYYEETGNGEPLLLISGLSGTTLGWEPVRPALAARLRVISFDNRGAGRSSAPPGPYSTRQMADDAAALLDRIGVARAHVVGLSMGGMIAQELALTYPDRVDRLVLLATYPRLRPGVHDPWLDAWLHAWERGMDSSSFEICMMPWMVSPAFMAQHDLVEAALVEALRDPYPASAAGIAGQVAACRAHDARDRLAGIAAPTLVLVGADDILSPVSYAEELAERIPGARLQVLERCGHIPHLEEPEAVTAALLAFLAA